MLLILDTFSFGCCIEETRGRDSERFTEMSVIPKEDGGVFCEVSFTEGVKSVVFVKLDVLWVDSSLLFLFEGVFVAYIHGFVPLERCLKK